MERVWTLGFALAKELIRIYIVQAERLIKVNQKARLWKCDALANAQ